MDTAAIVLGLAAAGGVLLAGIRLTGSPRPPTWMALGHGVIAATGLVLLGSAAYYPGVPQLAQIALGILVLAAVGGIAIFAGWHLREKALPVALVLGHGLIAATGYGCLLAALSRT